LRRESLKEEEQAEYLFKDGSHFYKDKSKKLSNKVTKSRKAGIKVKLNRLHFINIQYQATKTM
jgi:hypothetical protein